MKEVYTFIGIYVNCNPNFNRIDISFLNLKFVNLASNELKEFFARISSDGGHSHIQDIVDYTKKQRSSLVWIAVPIDTTKDVTDQTFKKLEQAILLMFLSDFRLYRIIAYRSVSSIPSLLALTVLINELPLRIAPLNLFDTPFEILAKFIKDYFNLITDEHYLSLSIKYFTSGSVYREYEMRFVNLCISIEALISGSTELSYRLARLCGVILGENVKEAEVIFKNVKLIYDLRSKIVHGEGAGYYLIKHYAIYANALVSRLLITLMSTANINSKKDLDDLISKSGYGALDSPFVQGRNTVFNMETALLIKQELPKKISEKRQ